MPVPSSNRLAAALPSIGWDADWRQPLPLDDLQWNLSTPRQAALRWLREGLPADRIRAWHDPEDPATPCLHDPRVCSVVVMPNRVDRDARQDRLTRLVLHRAELVARWAPAERFFPWFDNGTQDLPADDQQRLLVRCLLGAFDTDHRPVFDGLWTRWMDRVTTDRLSWDDFLHASHDRRPQPPVGRSRRNASAHSGRSIEGWGYDRRPYGRIRVEDPWGLPMRVEERFHSTHPWHLPFVERALTASGTQGGSMVQQWAHAGTCPVTAWSRAPMGPYRELPPVAAMGSPLRGWVWDTIGQVPAFVREYGHDILEGWLLRMIRDGVRSGAPGTADLWGRLLRPWVEAGARLPHHRNPNRDELDDRLPSSFDAPGARTWDPAVSNRQNNVPDSARRVWAQLTPIEQHLDEIVALSRVAQDAHPAPMTARPRGRL